MRCFVELNHSPFSPILCRCTSCRDDVVTMAAKPRRRRREERWREKESKKTNPEPNPAPKEERRQRGKKGRGEEDGERPRRDADVRTDPLISSPLSPRGYWSLCLWICIMPEHQTLRISPTHPLFDLPIQTAITTCDDATKTWQLCGGADGTSSTTSPRLFPV